MSELESARDAMDAAFAEAERLHAAYLAAYRQFAAQRDKTPPGKGKPADHTRLRLLHDAYKVAYDRYFDADQRHLEAQMRFRELGGMAA